MFHSPQVQEFAELYCNLQHLDQRELAISNQRTVTNGIVQVISHSAYSLRRRSESISACEAVCFMGIRRKASARSQNTGNYSQETRGVCFIIYVSI